MYDSDLAYIQHHSFSDFARAAGPGVLRILRSAGISPRAVIASQRGRDALNTDPTLSLWSRRIAALFQWIVQTCVYIASPGGVLIFDVFVKGRRMKYKTWRVGATWAVLAHVNEEPVRRRHTRDIVTFRKTGQGYRRRAERHVLTVSTPSALTAELRRAGFSVRSTRAYGGFRLPYRRLGFVARKPIAG
jgi:hypothetical protein